MDTAYLSEAFQDGFEAEDPDFGTITLRLHSLGELVLTTGNVVACDPFVFPETLPFAVHVPPGRYSVIVSVATFADNNDHPPFSSSANAHQFAGRWQPPKAKTSMSLRKMRFFVTQLMPELAVLWMLRWGDSYSREETTG
jgi:hypothetical protein